jgi:hypothetical protein
MFILKGFTPTASLSTLLLPEDTSSMEEVPVDCDDPVRLEAKGAAKSHGVYITKLFE